MSKLTGAGAARRRARKRPDKLDDKVLNGIRETVDEVHAAGRANIDAMTERRSGALRRNYRKTVRKSKLMGLVGYISRTARKNAFYARFVHDGTKKAGARPFHAIAVDQGQDEHNARMRRALKDTVSETAAPSGLAWSGRGKVTGV